MADRIGFNPAGGWSKQDDTDTTPRLLPSGGWEVNKVALTAANAVNPGVGTLVITGYAPTVARTAGLNLVPGTGVLTITGYAPVVAQSNNQAVVPGVGSLTITGYAPLVTKSANQNLIPGSGILTITGYAPTVSQSIGGSLLPGTGNIVITGHAPTVARTLASNILPGSGILTITGHAPSVVRTTGGGGGTSAADVWQYEIEAGRTAEELLRLMSAVLCGKTTVTDLGGGLAIVTFEAVNGTKIRVTASMTGSERTSLAYNDTF
jgi:hypothetical protein